MRLIDALLLDLFAAVFLSLIITVLASVVIALARWYWEQLR